MFLGLDLGTSSLKALVLDEDGSTVSTASASYPVDAPLPDRAETDPEAWWRAAVAAAREALVAAAGPSIDAIGLDGQMHGVVLVDEAGTTLRPAILWADSRAVDQLGRYAALTPGQRRRLANPPIPGAAGATLPWLAEHEPALMARAARALQPKDWLRRRLVGGEALSEPSDASGTLLYDVPADRWADDVIAAFGLRRELFPGLAASTSSAGGLLPEAARELGLRGGIPVAVGAADTAASALGAGLSSSGTIQLSMGTGGQIIRLVDRPAVDPTFRTQLFRSAAEGQWYAMAAVQNAGLALDWARRLLGADWPALFATARDGAPAEDDPLFIPNVTRERAHQPHPGPGAAFVGATLHHGQAALLRAALEGVALGVRLALEALPGGSPATPVRLVGGGGLSPTWRQMLADILGCDLQTVDMPNVASRGAALLGGIAVGRWGSVDEAAATTRTSGAVTHARADVHAAYGPRYERFQAICARLEVTATGTRPGEVSPGSSAGSTS